MQSHVQQTLSSRMWIRLLGFQNIKKKLAHSKPVQVICLKRLSCIITCTKFDVKFIDRKSHRISLFFSIGLHPVLPKDMNRVGKSPPTNRVGGSRRGGLIGSSGRVGSAVSEVVGSPGRVGSVRAKWTGSGRVGLDLLPTLSRRNHERSNSILASAMANGDSFLWDMKIWKDDTKAMSP
jgi:hypothetical protein